MLPPPNYRRAFWTSRHHAWLGILTLGLGFLSAEPLGLLIGGVAYLLGLIFLPDSAAFRRSVDAREAASHGTAIAAEHAAFQAQQQALLTRLSAGRRTRYQQLTSVCRDIEAASAEAGGSSETSASLAVSTRRQKLDELAWTFLRMLSVEQTIEVYLETERKEHVPAAVATLEAETQTLAAEVTVLKVAKSGTTALAHKERLLTSQLERLNTLRQRLSRIEQAQSNHDLVRSEQERLVEQVKLIRADAIATRNADTLASRIDLSIEHLAATNQWMSELAEFKDLTAQMPSAPAPSLTNAPTPPRNADFQSASDK